MVVRWLSVLLVFLMVFCSVYRPSKAAVISIDFGGEWIKVALVKPGVPMEIVLNKESKRKTAAVVSLRNDDRLFGDPALNTAVKYPKSAYRYLQLLVGQKFDSPIVQKYKEWFPFYDIRKDEERGTVVFQHDEDTVYSVEELVGMLFNHSRHIAEAYAGVPIRDVVITVPPFFNQAQRRVLIESASLVGLNVLQLMSDNSAAALNYGLFRQASFNTTPHYIMFYDMGATSTTATIVEYRKVQVKEGTLANVHPQLAVKGVGFSRLLGGLEMDIRLQQHLAKVFQEQKKAKGNVFESPRAMAKLLKEAKRVKQVLSANSDHYAQIEGLFEDVDFRAKVTRVEFEELCSDLLEQVGDPVRQALEAADMTLDEMDSVILVGGGTRVPKVQENLLKVVKMPELGKSLNTDEAIALGAVYQGAGHTKLFRVKKFIVKEGAIYPIQVSFSRITQSKDEDGDDEVVRTVKRTLFQRSNPYPSKKVLTFNRHSTDFSFQVFYGDLNFLSDEEKSYLGRLNLTEVYLAGVGAALQKHPQGEAKGIKAHFTMDESGLLNITNVESVFEYPDDVVEQSTLSKIGSTISSFFGMGGDESAKEDPSPSEGEEVRADWNETDASTDSGTRMGQEPESPGAQSETDPVGEGEAGQDSAAETGAESDVESETETESVSDEVESEPDSQEEEEVKEEVGSEEEEEEPSEATPTASSSDDGEESETGGQGKEEGETKEGKAEEGGTSDTPTLNTTSSANTSNTTNTTSKAKAAPKGTVVKINLTTEVTVLDMPRLSQTSAALSVGKLVQLQQRDDDKVANEKAKNSLESHIFETKDAMYSEAVMGVSTEDQRDVIITSLNEAADWLEDDGYIAETKTYKEKLRELKRISRAVFKRVSEAAKRPKLLANLEQSLNISQDFMVRMKNLSGEMQIFTEVEITTLEKLVVETQEWMAAKLEEQEAIPAHEEPLLMSHEIEDQTKRLDREIIYLLNKLRSHRPPSVKTAANKTNTTSSNQTKSDDASSSDEPPSPAPPPEEAETTPTDEATITEESLDIPTEGIVPEALHLDEADNDPANSEDGERESPAKDEEPPRQEL